MRGILDLGRTDDVTMSIDPHVFVERVVALGRAIVGPAVEIVTHVEAPPRRLLAQPRRLEQAVLDLVMNASDAMGDRGRVEIRWDEPSPEGSDGGFGVLSVIDSGPGMDEATLERVGEPFFTTKEAGKGSGIGLAAARLMAEHAGGSLTIESALGRGTTVRMRLPLAPDGAARRPVAARPRATRIVVVDADEVRRIELSDVLADVRRQVVAVATRQEASRHLATEPVDAVIIGDSAAGLHALATTAPVIEVSAKVDRDAVRELVRLAIDGAVS